MGVQSYEAKTQDVGGKLETVNDDLEGQTFTTSANGARLYCMRAQVYGSFLLVWFIKSGSNGGSRTTEEFTTYLSIIVGYLIVSLLGYRSFPPRWLRMRMTINGGEVNLVGYARNVTVPVASLRRIDIARSWMGRHRVIRIWDAYGSRYTIVSPVDGQRLESWATEVAAGECVPVERRVSLYLTLEPISTFLLTLFVGGSLSALFITN